MEHPFKILLTQTVGQIHGPSIETAVFTLDDIRQLINAKAFVVMFRPDVIDEILANGIAKTGYAFVLDLLLIEQLNRTTNISTEYIH